MLHCTDSQNPILTTNATATVSEFQSVTLTCHHNADKVKWWRGSKSILLIAFGTPCTLSDPRPDYMNCNCLKPNYTCVIPSLSMSMDKVVWKCSDFINSYSNEVILNITGKVY
ncbi:hypothetical protein DPMN_138527 [Dreissena polymorpha]|uniref:Uncharacterized protein n=1 Tax=Dreissena polymorpha TaxID=45954 RepID=A0A9D4JER8_DREPO|nr:hypothetical protein DPMN_138527 [Dreissena polymorpha]